MGARSENCAGDSLESGCERSRPYQRSTHRCLRNPSDPNPTKVHLGQVGLSSPHRPVNLFDSCGVILKEPKHFGGVRRRSSRVDAYSNCRRSSYYTRRIDEGKIPQIEMRTKIKQQGFTLLEIMLVVSIIVIILGVAISKLGNTTAIAKSMRVQADVQAIKTQLQLYESMNGFFPTTEQGLQALVTQPQNDPRPTRWYQLFKELPKDPWGSDYIYL